jgi:hypothetical protein
VRLCPLRRRSAAAHRAPFAAELRPRTAPPQRVVLGLGAAIVMLFIEMTLYIARSLAVERDASKRKSKKRR